MHGAITTPNRCGQGQLRCTWDVCLATATAGLEPLVSQQCWALSMPGTHARTHTRTHGPVPECSNVVERKTELHGRKKIMWTDLRVIFYSTRPHEDIRPLSTPYHGSDYQIMRMGIGPSAHSWLVRRPTTEASGSPSAAGLVLRMRLRAGDWRGGACCRCHTRVGVAACHASMGGTYYYLAALVVRRNDNRDGINGVSSPVAAAEIYKHCPHVTIWDINS